MKCVAGRAGEHRGSQAGFPALWLGRQHRFPRGCAAVSQLISAALALFFPKILPHSPVRAFCFPPSLMMLFQSHLFVPVLLAQPSTSCWLHTVTAWQHQLCPNSLVTSTRTAQAPATPQCWTKLLMVCQDQEDPGIETTEKLHGSAQKHNWSF